MNYSQTDLIFFCGLIEGDGALWISKENKDGKIVSHAMVAITNNNLPLLLYLQEKFDGTIHTKYKIMGEHKHITHQWHLPAKNIEPLLSEALPLLISKKEVARLLIEFRKTVNERGTNPSQEQKLRRENLYEQYIKLVEINKKNIVKIKSSPLSPST